MINSCEAELICDFAEVYHIYGLESVPVELAATLAAGLRQDSRVQMKLSERRVPDWVTLLAMAVDALNWLMWSKTKDARHKRNMPESVAAQFTRKPEQERKQIQSFRSGAEFRAAWDRVILKFN